MKRSSILLALVAAASVAAIACSTNSSDSSVEASEDEVRSFNPARSDAGETLPATSSVNGYSLGGFEYWPYGAVEAGESPYPEKVQWGFAAGSEKARLCMAEARRELAKILQNPPAELVEFKTKKGISSFYSWNNDMQGADEGVEPAFPDIWLYNGSLIKWISETKRDGKCKIPTRADLVRFLKAELEE